MDSQKDFVVSQHIGFQKVNRTLQATSDPAMLDLENSTSCLQIVKAHLETVEGEVNSIAKQVQKDISSTEIKLNDSNEKLKTVEASYDNCLENIALLEKRKQECDADSKLELARAHNNWKAIKPSITKAAKDIRLIYALGYIASAALSPFTLGGSMAVTACTHAVAVARISSDIGDTMSIATKIAESYKLTARQLVDDIQELSVKCKIEEAEMKRLKSETGEMGRS
ncbi:hypothetical protein MAR_035565 [Mya arenaria]|uniref:Uncharacterized protein n=1 Tax=Mya arenaria TaxID=6604 RepID=A0ABY7EQ02_MYAAR|nr:hypothetical protein MAR_035565 [Mya arenaria]